MAGRLEGKVCVITGAGGGMGADAAVRFAEEGAQIAVADVDGARRREGRGRDRRTGRAGGRRGRGVGRVDVRRGR